MIRSLELSALCAHQERRGAGNELIINHAYINIPKVWDVGSLQVGVHIQLLRVWGTPSPRGKKLLCSIPLRTSPYVSFYLYVHLHSLKYQYLGLPWWCSSWESACQCRGHGFQPWSGKIPCAAEQLGPWATTTEPARLEPVLHNKRGRNSESLAHRDEEWPLLAATRESPRTETKTQHSQK